MSSKTSRTRETVEHIIDAEALVFSSIYITGLFGFEFPESIDDLIFSFGDIFFTRILRAVIAIIWYFFILIPLRLIIYTACLALRALARFEMRAFALLAFTLFLVALAIFNDFFYLVIKIYHLFFNTSTPD